MAKKPGVMDIDDKAHLYELFASLLEYPTPALPGQIQRCTGMLAHVQPRAAEWLGKFEQAILQLSQEQREELYTSTFDLQPVCCPYLGHQLFGESYKRGVFMARLNQRYREQGFYYRAELPDHITIVLQFLASSKAAITDEFNQVLLDEGLVPALKKMSAAFDSPAGNPYAALFQALLLVLEDEPEKERSNA